MDFGLNDEHRMLQDSLRAILTRHQGKGLWDELAQAGVMGALLTEAEGGFDGSGAVIALIFQELGRAGAALPLTPTLIAGAALAQAGSRVDLVEGLAAGTTLAAFADAEPGTRHDRGVAIRADDARLTGRKVMVAGADRAAVILVTTTDALWLVDARARGLTITPYPLMDDMRGADLDFDAVPAIHLGTLSELGGPLTRGLLAHCAQGLGGIEAGFDLTLDHLRARKQFGRPLIEFQALSHRIADLAVEVEQARSAVINLAGHLDADAPLRDRHAQACKVTIGRAARLMAEESVQLHGGIGMTQEYALAGLVRRLLACDTAMGDCDYHLERFAMGDPAWA